jgi:glycosyltransferase involved in cell wall biosynthesis
MSSSLLSSPNLIATSPKLERKLIIIVPAFNEQDTVAETIAVLKAAQNDCDSGYRWLVYVINDGSQDATAQVSIDAGADRVINHRVNLGLGAAVRTGLIAARTDGADAVIKFDADRQHDPADISAMLEFLKNDSADVIYGNRFERINYSMPLVRRIGNIVFTKLMSWLTQWEIKDSQPGIFCVNRAYLCQFYLPGDYNYTQQILLDAYHKGMRFAQVPVAFRKRLTGSSFVSLKYPLKVIPQIVMVLVGVKPLKVFAPIGVFCLLLGGGIATVQFILWLFAESAKPVTNVNLVLGLLLFGMQSLFFGLLADLIVKKTAGITRHPLD